MCSQVGAGQTPENAISCEESSLCSHVMRQIPKSLQLDAIDRGILNELQNDGRLSNVELAARVHQLLGRGWQRDGQPIIQADLQTAVAQLAATMEGLDLIDHGNWHAWAAGPSARSLLPRVSMLADLLADRD